MIYTEEVRGLVLRSTDVSESDRLITIYTDKMGVLPALARGARSLKSRCMSATMPFCYSKFVLYKRGDKYWIRETELIESFFDIRRSVEGLALAGYILEVLDHVAVAEPDEALLRLTLNTLFAISSGKYDLSLVKAAFEVRLTSHIGFMPDVVACADCGEKSGDFYFDIMGGRIECYACHEKRVAEHRETDPAFAERHLVSILSEGAKTAFCYCIFSPLEKLLSFSVEGEDRDLFAKAAETYLLNHLERDFKSLDFYKDVAR